MTAASISQGITMLEDCDASGPTTPSVSGTAPSAPLAGGTFTTSAPTLNTGFNSGLGGTGRGNMNWGSVGTGNDYAAQYPLSSPHNFSGSDSFLLVHVLDVGKGAITNLASSGGGARIMAQSSTTGSEERVWPVIGGDTSLFSHDFCVINVNRTADAEVSSGTFQENDVTNVGVVVTNAATFRNVGIESICELNTIEIINGDATPNGPGVFQDILDYIDNADCVLSESPTANYHYIGFPWRVGDGSTATRFVETGRTWEFGPQPVFTGEYKEARFHVNDNDFGFSINASASDFITFDACQWLCDSASHFRIQGSASATVTFNGCTIALSDGELIIEDGMEFSACIFDGMAGAQVSQPTFSGVTFKNTSNSAVIFDSTNGDSNISSVTFDNCVVAIEVNLNSNCAIDVTNFTFNSNCTDFIRFNGSSGATLTVTSPSNIDSGKLLTPNGGSINVVSSAVFTINTNVSALIQVFTTNTQTVLDSTTGTSLAYSHSDNTVDYVVQAAGYLPQRITGVTLSGAQSVTVNLVEDPVYNASHGLTRVTDYDYDETTRELTIVAAQQGRDIYSALIDDFISESDFFNKPFPLSAVGIDRIDFTSDGTTGATINSGDIQYWRGAGMEWEHDTTGNPTHKFCSIVGTGTNTAGTKGYYQQVDGASPTLLSLVNNNINQVIRYYRDDNGDGDTSDTNEYDYSDHLVVKLFNDGYYQVSSNILTAYDVSVVESFEYVVPMQLIETGLGTGDRGITITVTDNSTTPVEEQTGYFFDYKIEGGASDSPEDLLRQWIYDVYTDPTASTYASKVNFNWPDPIIESGGSYSTQRGFVYGQDTTTTFSGFYVEEGTGYHPDFLRQQSNSGSYFTTPVVAQINISGMTTTETYVRLQLWNVNALSASAWQASTSYSAGDIVLRTSGIGTENTAGLYMRCTTAGTSNDTEPTWDTTIGNTTSDTNGSGAGDVVWTTFAVLNYDDDPASATYSTTYNDGEEFLAGETVGYRFASINGSTAADGDSGTAIVSSSGFTIAISPDADTVYATNGIDGQAEDAKFSPDFTNDYIVLDANADFQGIGAYAYYRYILTTSQGMWNFWGGVTALDVSNYRINTSVVDLYFDESGGFIKQTDSVRIFRDDGTRPAIDPTTGGNGIEINWRNPVYAYDGGGGGFTSSDRATLEARSSHTAADVWNVVNATTSNTYGQMLYQTEIHANNAYIAASNNSSESANVWSIVDSTTGNTYGQMLRQTEVHANNAYIAASSGNANVWSITDSTTGNTYGQMLRQTEVHANNALTKSEFIALG